MEILASDFIAMVVEISFSLPKKRCIFSISFGEWFFLVHLAFKPMFSTASSISTLRKCCKRQRTEYWISNTTHNTNILSISQVVTIFFLYRRLEFFTSLCFTCFRHHFHVFSPTEVLHSKEFTPSTDRS